MPVYGQGVIPAASSDVAAELTAITRRSFIPKLVVQIYKSTPMLQKLLDNAQTTSGGVSSVTVPVQGQSMVNMQWSDYSGNFSQPAAQRGIFDAEFDLKLAVVPIPFLGMEGLVQMDHAVVPLIDARMNDAKNVFLDGLSTAILGNYVPTATNATSPNNQQIVGLPGACDDATNQRYYGNIDRTTYTWWKGVRFNAGNVNPTRDLIAQYINSIVKATGEAPKMGLCGFGLWTALVNSILPIERVNYTNGGAGSDHLSVGWRSIDIAGVPIYPDPYADANNPGSLYLINSDYLNLYIHKNGSFTFSGFQSTIPNFQIGFVGVMVFLAELVCTKCSTQGRIDNLNYISL